MKIAQIAPLAESVPPRLYGGTERVVFYLTEELVRLGHDVTLFASGDSQTSARLVACAPRALRLDPRVRDPLPHHLLMIERVKSRAHEFDVLHFHVEHVHLPLFRPFARKSVTTLHGRLDLPDLVPLYREFDDMPLVSISDAQREPIPRANWRRTIHHGIPAGIARLYPDRGRYLAFVGRVSPEKRVDRAIEIAHRAGLPIKIAAKVDAADREYFEDVVRPLLSGRGIEFIGEIAEEDKDAFLGHALALLFPIDWPEPFGLVMIEAMARGTPVIAFAGGSVREVVENGLTGYVVSEIPEAVRAVERASSLDRAAIRREFERRFTADRMARDYAGLYARQIEERARKACEPASMT